MSGSWAQASEPVPDCSKCGRPMVRRTARRRAKPGIEFRGCSEFPRCRGIVQHQPPVDAPADEDAAAAVKRAQGTPRRLRAQMRAAGPGGSSPKSQRPATEAIAGIWNETSLMPPAAGTTLIGPGCSPTSMTATAGDAGCPRGRCTSGGSTAMANGTTTKPAVPSLLPSVC